jgi:electron transfer flavoprotein alpha subunit
MKKGIVLIVANCSKQMSKEKWHNLYDPAVKTAFYLRKKLDLPLHLLIYGQGDIPSSILSLPFDEFCAVEDSLPLQIDPYDLATIFSAYIKKNNIEVVITPSDGNDFPLIAGAISTELSYGFTTSVTSVEVFNKSEFYVVRPSIEGRLTQIFFMPVIISVSASPHSMPSSIGGPTSSSIGTFSVKSAGLDKMLLTAKADVIPPPVSIKKFDAIHMNSTEKAINWLFEN